MIAYGKEPLQRNCLWLPEWSPPGFGPRYAAASVHDRPSPRGSTKNQKLSPTGPFSPVLLPMIVARGAASPLAAVA